MIEQIIFGGVVAVAVGLTLLHKRTRRELRKIHDVAPWQEPHSAELRAIHEHDSLPRYAPRGPVAHPLSEGEFEADAETVAHYGPELLLAMQRTQRPPEFGKRKRKTIPITPRVMEKANIQRKLMGRPPMSREGFLAAVDNCPVFNRDSRDWLTWFIMYEAEPEHRQARVAVDTGYITVPVGGASFGAGTPGAWDGTRLTRTVDPMPGDRD